MKDLTRFMDEAVERIGVSGIDCVVWQDHKEIFRHQAGYSDVEAKAPVDPNALYNIYSASKPITCTAVLQLLEQGRLLLTDPLYEYLPEFRNMQVKYGTFVIQPAKNPITIEHLMTMTAGLAYENDTPAYRAMVAEKGEDFTTRDFVKTLAQAPLLFEPGTDWNYSYCHDVLGAVVEAVSGMSFGEYLKKNIFEPLGMNDTGFRPNEAQQKRIAPQYMYAGPGKPLKKLEARQYRKHGAGFESGGGGIISSAHDYILFADALSCDGVGATGERILSHAALQMFHTSRLSGKALESFHRQKPEPGLNYCLGVANYDDPAACGHLVPKDSFYWGGVGGFQNLFDPANRVSYLVCQHCVFAPKPLLNPHMYNILYANLTR